MENLPDWMIAVSTLLLAVAAISGVTFFGMSRWWEGRQASRYDAEHNRATLSLVRDSYEQQIREMNMRLMATEERFREVNHLLIDNQDSRTSRFDEAAISADRFLEELGISEDEREVDQSLVFILTPFNEFESSAFKAVADVVQRSGFTGMRGDEIYTSGDILPHVVRLIVKSRFIVANISGRNPNVYYELGIAHALGKPTILVSKTMDDVPFDLRSKRIVLFRSESELREGLSLAITRALAKLS